MKDLIKIFPEVQFDAQCPNDDESLQVKEIVIPGMRCLADTVCPICDNRYYIDLPTGQALWSPSVLNQATAEIYDPFNIFWFSSLLKEGYLNPVKSEVLPVVHKFFDADHVVIINCLDFLYGHSLLKLLNVQHHLESWPELGCCVLVPSQLKHLVPDGVAEIWEFPVPVKEGWKWYPSLQSWIKQQLATRKEVFLSPAYSHPSNQVYDLQRFVKEKPDISQKVNAHEPVILFSYREDRLWGRSQAHQQRNLQKLYNQLSSIFPKMIFILVGFGKQSQICETGAKLIDLRTERFDVQRDRLWMAYMRATDCAIGVHGSNMLLPSGLAKSTVELVPRSRIGNTVQDFLFACSNHDNRDALLYYRMLYGNESLTNIQPSAVTDIVTNVLAYAPLNSEWFKASVDRNIKESLNSVISEVTYKQARSYLTTQVKVPFIHRKARRLAEALMNLLD